MVPFSDGGVNSGPYSNCSEPFERHPPQLRREVEQVVFGGALQIERRRLAGERLRRRRPLTRHRRLRHRPFLDGPDRLARRPVEDVGERLLAYLDDRLDRPAVHRDVGQDWPRGEVVVPYAVVHRLEVPDPLAGPGVDADQALRVQVVAVSVPAVLVVRGGRCRQVDVVELRVVRHPVPHVGVAGVLCRAVQPGLIACLVLLRDGVERPELPARAHVVRLDVARRHLLRAEAVGNGIADDDHVAGDKRAPGREVGPADRVADADHDVDLALDAELRVRLAGPRVNRDQPGVVGAEHQPLLRAVGPIGEAAMEEADVGGAARGVRLRIMHPPGLARGRVQRGDQPERGHRIQQPVDHERRVLVAPTAPGRVRSLQLPVGRRPAPCHFEIVDVVLRDLVERRVLHPLAVAREVRPLPVLGAALRNCRRSKQSCRGHDDGQHPDIFTRSVYSQRSSS